jgi:hypothetical protein
VLSLQLIDIKAKQGRQASTSSKKDKRKVTQEVEFNIPQLLCVYLSQIGDVTDKMGQETKLEVPPVPTSVAQRMGGYHTFRMDKHPCNLFEEIPSLGITGDMVMAFNVQWKC